MRRVLLAVAVVLSLGGECVAGASVANAAPAIWSVARFSAVVTAQGLVANDGTPDFLPALGIGYNLTSQVTLAFDAGHEFSRDGSIYRAGARAHIADFGEGHVFLGANYVRYSGSYERGDNEGWEGTVNGAWPIARRRDPFGNVAGPPVVWLVGSIGRDPEHDLTSYRLGARYQFLGGKPQP